MKALKIALFSIFMTAILSACSITFPVNATSNPVGKKVGTSTATVIFGLAFDQDASIRTAAIDANISKISTVDIKTYSIMGFYTTYTTIVTGE